MGGGGYSASRSAALGGGDDIENYVDDMDDDTLVRKSFVVSYMLTFFSIFF
jgi:hypothetical protein